MKKLFIVRGLPGSGKSTFALQLANDCDFLVCEADKYFVDKTTGVYNFDASKLKEAHKYCFDLVETYMKDSLINEQFYKTIVVSNTFTQEWEIIPYIELAKKYDYQFTSIICENRHNGVNLHGVPDEKIEVMRKRFELKL